VYETIDRHHSSSSLSNSLNLILVAATAASSGLKRIRSVLKVPRPKIPEQRANEYLVEAASEAGHDFEKRDENIDSNSNDFRKEIDRIAKSKMHWYFRNEFHRTCLSLVSKTE
jgi:hypothetical protein